MFVAQRNEYFKECLDKFRRLLPNVDLPEMLD